MLYVGIDLGGTNVAVGIVDEDGHVLHRLSVPTGVHSSDEGLMDHLASTARLLLERSGVSREEIAWVGIGSPGSVDPERGVVLSACNLNLNDTPLGEGLSHRLELPVYVENDANCAVWAEATVGAAAGMRDVIMVTLGPGVGGGIVIGGRLYSGFNHFGGEFGHAVICADGEPCACGDRGCFEAYSSATALIRDTRRAAEADPESLIHRLAREEGRISGRTAFCAARLGDPSAEAVVRRYVHYLAVGVGALIRIFQPEALVIGGGVACEGEGLFEPLRREVADNIYRDGIAEDKRTKILPARLGNDAGIVGAALLGLCRKNGK